MPDPQYAQRRAPSPFSGGAGASVDGRAENNDVGLDRLAMQGPKEMQRPRPSMAFLAPNCAGNGAVHYDVEFRAMSTDVAQPLQGQAPLVALRGRAGHNATGDEILRQASRSHPLCEQYRRAPLQAACTSACGNIQHNNLGFDSSPGHRRQHANRLLPTATLLQRFDSGAVRESVRLHVPNAHLLHGLKRCVPTQALSRCAGGGAVRYHVWLHCPRPRPPEQLPRAFPLLAFVGGANASVVRDHPDLNTRPMRLHQQHQRMLPLVAFFQSARRGAICDHVDASVDGPRLAHQTERLSPSVALLARAHDNTAGDRVCLEPLALHALQQIHRKSPLLSLFPCASGDSESDAIPLDGDLLQASKGRERLIPASPTPKSSGSSSAIGKSLITISSGAGRNVAVPKGTWPNLRWLPRRCHRRRGDSTVRRGGHALRRLGS
mmetsp:Transcript_83460/g.232819  ORF Transcript_83460/g.232819 Transcript_83460/m.232819 type:complete len:435 (-) Transcript_83460:283-1587(-)